MELDHGCGEVSHLSIVQEKAEKDDYHEDAVDRCCDGFNFGLIVCNTRLSPVKYIDHILLFTKRLNKLCGHPDFKHEDRGVEGNEEWEVLDESLHLRYLSLSYIHSRKEVPKDEMKGPYNNEQLYKQSECLGFIKCFGAQRYFWLRNLYCYECNEWRLVYDGIRQSDEECRNTKDVEQSSCEQNDASFFHLDFEL